MPVMKGVFCAKVSFDLVCNAWVAGCESNSSKFLGVCKTILFQKKMVSGSVRWGAGGVPGFLKGHLVFLGSLHFESFHDFRGEGYGGRCWVT